MELPFFPEDIKLINPSIGFVKREDTVYYFNGQMPVFAHAPDDRASFKMYMAHLYVNGIAKQSEINRAFDMNPINMKRWSKKYREEGPDSFFKKVPRKKRPHVLTKKVLAKIQSLLDQGEEIADIARELDLKYDTIRKAVKSGKLHRTAPVKKKSEVGRHKSSRSREDTSAALGFGCTNQSARYNASLGELSEAITNFGNYKDISKGGVLFTLPSLLANGLLKFTDKYFKLSDGYYSLVHIFITLAFVVMLRIKSIEAIKHCNPAELGKLLGIDRIPEINTLRNKLDILSQSDNIEQWRGALSRDWMQSEEDLAGVLYVDGHVRVYNGKQTKLPRRYVARQKLCLRGITDYWLNDALGQPFFVVSTFQTKGLLSMLKSDIVPRLLKEVPGQPDQNQLDQNPYLKRFTLVFDREGYSPKFFKKMWGDHRISCYTYHKYARDKWPEYEFSKETVVMANGEKIEMQLAERGTYLSNQIWVREVRKLTENGHQTSLICTDYTNNIRQIAVNMFSRWSQENFFKYMRKHFGIDRLIEYEIESINETTEVKNPKYRELERKLRSVSQKLKNREQKFGKITYKEQHGEKIKHYIDKKTKLLDEIQAFQSQKKDIQKQKKQTEKYIIIGELPKGEKFCNLAEDKKHIIDTIKMIAYRAETGLANLIKSVMGKPDEARAIIREITQTEIDLVPDKNNNILYVKLHPLTTRASNQIVHYLCGKLNETETKFPGTDMKIFYKLVAL